ncbi:MAG: tyrosine--tRNA ligase [Candidatus Sungbacteria bacterium]|nr:tyrosine--tRNA ligase [Candidatus Sungbacteria bacterium]
MDTIVAQKKDLITKHTEEIITGQDLETLLARGEPIKHYIGFEISGEIHLGTGIAAIRKVKDIADAGVTPTIFLADWHTWINDKLGGDRAAIKRIAAGYFKEGISACYRLLGGNSDNLTFVLGSDLYHDNDAYWETMVSIAKHTTLNRAKRSISILGREAGEEIDMAKMIYPIMQVADIFALGVNIAHAGMDQRKAHVIARDVAGKIGKEKPVALHHHLLLGLGKPPQWPLSAGADKQELWASLKMSKSKPESAVFITDAPETIREKVTKAFCPPREIAFNPIIDWAEYLIFNRRNDNDPPIMIKRKRGNNLELNTTHELKTIYQKGEVMLHPEDLKHFVADYLINFLAPIRDHFAKGAPKEMWEDLQHLKQK